MDGVWVTDGKIEEMGAGLRRVCEGENEIIWWKAIWKAATEMLRKW